MAHLTYEQRVQINTLFHIANWRQYQIADRLGIPPSTVSLVVNTPQTPPKPKGRKPVCGTSTRKRLINRATINKSHRRMPLFRIAELEGLNYCPQTIVKAFAKEGYYRRIAREKPVLTDKHIADRLAFAKQYIDWDINQWRKVIWTDEASIRVGWFGQVYITRKTGEEFDKDCLAARFKKYSEVMVWGAISLDGAQDSWIFDKGGINSERYCLEIGPILNQIRLNLIEKWDNGDEPILMQDNASSHNAKQTIALLRAMDLVKLNWPARSPDLNPIENIWYLIKHRIGQHFPTNRDECIAAFELEWSRLTREDIVKCIESMPARLQAVIDANEGHTRW